MATAQRELFSSADRSAEPRVIPESMQPLIVAADAGTPSLAKWTAMAVNSSTAKWVPYDVSGGNDIDTIRGFLGEAVTLDASDDLNRNIMTKGEIFAADVPLNSGTYGTRVQINAALVGGTPTLRELGIRVKGLTTVK